MMTASCDDVLSPPRGTNLITGGELNKVGTTARKDTASLSAASSSPP
ncbi:hypothetical protein [Vibrio diazotrophicus]|nr:hypothetical protein [Vibrio diazotrophicus]